MKLFNLMFKVRTKYNDYNQKVYAINETLGGAIDESMACIMAHNDEDTRISILSHEETEMTTPTVCMFENFIT